MKEKDFDFKELLFKIDDVEKKIVKENKKFKRNMKVLYILFIFHCFIIIISAFIILCGVDIFSWQSMNAIQFLFSAFCASMFCVFPPALMGFIEVKHNNKLLKLSDEKKILCKEYEKYKSYLVQKEKSVDLDKNTENNIINQKQESASFIETTNLEDSHVKEKNGNAIKKRVLTKDNKRIK